MIQIAGNIWFAFAALLVRNVSEKSYAWKRERV